MYLPEAFRVDDPAVLRDFMQQHSFATLVTTTSAGPFASHLPFLIHGEQGQPTKLVGHVARANPQWEHFADGLEVLVIFQGPHAYISPAFYAAEQAVPTWNYTAVHAYGRPRLLEEPQEVATVLQQLVTRFEEPRSQPWQNQLSPEFLAKLQLAIVAFEIPISRLEGKFKLSQNRSPADREGVIRELSRSENADEREVAAMMEKLGK